MKRHDGLEPSSESIPMWSRWTSSGVGSRLRWSTGLTIRKRTSPVVTCRDGEDCLGAHRRKSRLLHAWIACGRKRRWKRRLRDRSDERWYAVEAARALTAEGSGAWAGHGDVWRRQHEF